MLKIRNATYHDAPIIKGLLTSLGYQTNTILLIDQLERQFGNEANHAYVAEIHKEVVGFVAVHFLPRLAYDGGIAIIGYLSVDEAIKGIDVAVELEKYVTEQCRLKKCNRIQVYCMDFWTHAHQFYLQQGYQEYPKYFTKRLVYAE